MPRRAELVFEAVARELGERLGDDARIVGGWYNPEVTPPIADAETLRLVFSWSPETVAGLRPWRDGYEMVVTIEGAEVHVVAHEASTWARLVLKRHAPTFALAASGAVVGDAAVVQELSRIMVGEPEKRFDGLEAWLRRARRFGR